ncbi:MAG: ABC transporter permease [Clostridiales bacterium]|nr:ABC transporter permease [Clostridiales bacterium]
MTKLLSAGCYRLFKSRVFWIMLVICILLQVLVCVDNFRYERERPENTVILDDIVFSIVPAIGFISSALISLLLGEEYSDGVMRNKLTVGHRRSDIYFANLIVCTAGSFIMLAALFLSGGLLGFALFGGFTYDAGTVLWLVLCCFLLTAALSSIDVLVVMCCQNKAVAAVLSLALVLVMLFAGSYLDSVLNEPEMQYGAMVVHEDGVMEFVDPAPNPHYVSGMTRTVMAITEDIIPMGQAIQINNFALERSARWPLLSIALFTAVSALGYAIFKKKDIK